MRPARVLAPLAAVFALATGGAVALTGAGAQSGAPPADETSLPLVYVFSLDALDGDRVDANRAPFLSSLLAGEGARSTYFRESRGIMVAETNPNHTAMSTGAFGDKSGIPGNAFAVYGEAARKACPGDAGEGPNAPQTTDGEFSDCRLAETFFEAVARQPRPDQVTTAGIYGKPKLARLLERRADFNWTPCTGSGDAPYCRNVPANPINGYALSDETVMDEVLRTVREGVDADGARKRPNLTFVNFQQIDVVGHATGARAEYETAIGLMDQQLRRFVEQQKRLGLWDRTVVLLVSDHSMDTTLTKTTLASRFTAGGVPSSAFEVVQNGSVDMVYLTDRTSPGRFELLKRMRAAAVATGGVDEALYREENPQDGGKAHTLDAVHPEWRIAGERTGDLFVTHKESGAFSDPFNPLTGNHGGPQTVDNTFAVIGGALVRQQSVAGERGERFDDTARNPGQAQNVDVAPTALALLGRRPPAQSEGRVLAEAFAPTAPLLLPPLSCPAPPTGLAVAAAGPARGGALRVVLRRASGTGRARVDLLRVASGRRVLRRGAVARRRASVARVARIPGRGLRDGAYVARVTARGPRGTVVRRIGLLRSGGRFARLPSFERPRGCGVVRRFELSSPVFGGSAGAGLRVTLRLGARADTTVSLLRGGRVVRRIASGTRAAGNARFAVSARGLRAGRYVVRVSTRRAGDGAGRTVSLGALRLR